MESKIYKQKQTEDMKDKKRVTFNKIILFAIIILFFSGIAVLSFLLEKPKSKYTLTNTQPNCDISGSQTTIRNSSLTASGSGISDISEEIKYPVYIVGEVNKPGIYEIKAGIFLYQLVDMAGGLTSKAAKNSINLAFQITKNQMIKIPSQEDMNTGSLGGIEEGLLLKKETGINNDPDIDPVSSKININTADIAELDKLPGIGAATALLIVDFRAKNGKFKLIEDIMKIPGIKENKFNQIKDRISVK